MKIFRVVLVAGLILGVHFHSLGQCTMPSPCNSCACFNTQYTCYSNDVVATVYDILGYGSLTPCEIYNCAVAHGRGEAALHAMFTYSATYGPGSSNADKYLPQLQTCFGMTDLFDTLVNYHGGVVYFTARDLTSHTNFNSCQVYTYANSLGKGEEAIIGIMEVMQYSPGNGLGDRLDELLSCPGVSGSYAFDVYYNHKLNYPSWPYTPVYDVVRAFLKSPTLSLCDIYSYASSNGQSQKALEVLSDVFFLNAWQGGPVGLDTCASACDLFNANYDFQISSWSYSPVYAASLTTGNMANFTSFTPCEILTCATNINQDSIALLNLLYYTSALQACVNVCILYDAYVNLWINNRCSSPCDTNQVITEGIWYFSTSTSYLPCEIYGCAASGNKKNAIGALAQNSISNLTGLQSCVTVCNLFEGEKYYQNNLVNGYGNPVNDSSILAASDLYDYTSFTPCNIYNCVEAINQPDVVTMFLNKGVSSAYLQNTCGINLCLAAGTSCNDNLACTINDVEDGNCNCAGTFSNQNPFAVAGGPYTISIGQTVQLNGSGSLDPDAACGDVITAYSWDLDNNLSFGDASGSNPLVSWVALNSFGITGAGSFDIWLRVTDSHGATKLGLASLTVTSSAYSWDGSTNTDWFTPSNWASNTLPDENTDVTIAVSSNYPEIVGPGIAKAKNLTIDANASLEVSQLNGGTLQIFGEVTVNGSFTGSGTLSFQSGAAQSITGNLSFSGVVNVTTGTTLTTGGNLILQDGASLMHGIGTPGAGGAVSGNIQYKRQGTTVANSFNFWSSPIQNQNVSIFGGNAYYYAPGNAHDLTETGLTKGWVVASGTMTPGLGYGDSGSGLVTFSGAPNNAPTGTDITVTIDKPLTTISLERNPWNLVGNPFPSALDANLFQQENGPTGTGLITGTLYFWEDDNSGGVGWTASEEYAVWNVLGVVPRFDPSSTGSTFNGYIASGQSFFVEKINNGTSQLKFKNSMRSSADNSSFFRNMPVDRVYLGVFNPDSQYNETMVAFMDDATDGVDLQYDAKKMKGNPGIALGTKLNNDFYTIQAFAPFSGDKTVQLALDANKSGIHHFKMMAIENLDESVVVLLEDRLLGTFQNLRLLPTYSVNITAGLDINRFYLHFNSPLEATAMEESCNGNDGEISLQQQGSKIWNYQLLNQQGTVIDSDSSFNGSVSITGLNGENYTLVLTDIYGYQVTKQITIADKTPVTCDFDAESITLVGMPVTFEDLSTGAMQWNWDFGDGNTSIIQNPVHTYSNPGLYPVMLTASNTGCSDYLQKDVEVINLATGINTRQEGEVKIYSFNGTVYLEFINTEAAQYSLDIFTVLGQRLMSKTVQGIGTYSYQLDHIHDQYVILKLRGNESVQVKKVWLNR